MPLVARSLTRDHGMDARVAVRSSSGIQTRSSLERRPALVAQLDRAPDFESGGRGFESLRARQFSPRRVPAASNRGSEANIKS